MPFTLFRISFKTKWKLRPTNLDLRIYKYKQNETDKRKEIKAQEKTDGMNEDQPQIFNGTPTPPSHPFTFCLV